jgi:hypothetical protein
VQQVFHGFKQAVEEHKATIKEWQVTYNDE